MQPTNARPALSSATHNMPPTAKPSSGSSTVVCSENEFGINGWRFCANIGAIVSSARDAAVSSELNIKLPTMLFDDNYLGIQHQQSGLSISFCARDALRGVGPADPAVQVRAAKVWRGRSERRLAPVLKNASDWTFTTKYAGYSVFSHRKNSLDTSETDVFVHGKTSGNDLQQIDYVYLQNVDVPILFFKDIVLFEDELDDNGIAFYRVRMVSISDFVNCLVHDIFTVRRNRTNLCFPLSNPLE